MPMTSIRDSGVRTSTLAIMDGASLLVFTVIGLMTHGAEIAPGPVLRDVVPILGVWYLLAPVSRTYRTPGWSTLLLSWALAVPLGVLVRQVWVGRVWSRATVVFLIAAMSLTLVFLLTGRVLVTLAGRNRRP